MNAERRLCSLSRQLLPLPTTTAAAALADEDPTGKPKLAIICTVWYYLTHGQHEGDRFNHGYPMHGKWQDPEVELVSICKPANPCTYRACPETRLELSLLTTHPVHVPRASPTGM